VHYQRDILRRPSIEQRWQTSDPEFDDFLNALSPVHRAAATGNVELLDELLNDGANEGTHWKVPPHSMYRHDRTGWDFTGAPPIHFAAYYGHNSAVLYLLSCGADIEAKDSAGTTALHAAAWTGNEGLFKILMKKGADASVCDYDGWSVAIYAMSQGHDSITRLLLGEAGGDTEMLVKTYKLRHAAKLGNTEAVLGMLLEDQESRSGEPTQDDDATTELFLGEALLGASEGGHVELVRTLLAKGADACAVDDTGSTCLHWAGWGGHAEIGNQLYDGHDEQGVDVGSRLKLTSVRHEESMKLLLEAGADINTQNVQGCTPLHWVSGAGSVPMMKFFVDQGANPEIEDYVGRTAVDRARETGDEGVFGELAR
jgi:ankyrin repeat protein